MFNYELAFLSAQKRQQAFAQEGRKPHLSHVPIRQEKRQPIWRRYSFRLPGLSSGRRNETPRTTC